MFSSLHKNPFNNTNTNVTKNYSFGSNTDTNTTKNYSFGSNIDTNINKNYSFGSSFNETQNAFGTLQNHPVSQFNSFKPIEQQPVQQPMFQTMFQQPVQQPVQQLFDTIIEKDIQMQNTIDNQSSNQSSKKAISFNDINIIPVLTDMKSDQDISFSSKFTKSISLSLPIVSFSNNVQNIIDLNLLGALGILKSDDLEKQIQFINTLKNYLKFIDETPITISSNANYDEIKNTFLQYSCDYITVIDESNTFLGFITSSYFDIVSILDNNIHAYQIMITLENLKCYKTYDYNWNNLLVENPVSSIINDLKIFPLIPIICDSNKLYGVITLKNITSFYKYRNKSTTDKKGKLITAISTGIFSDSIDRINTLVNLGLDIIFIQIDNAYNNCLINTIKDIKNKFPILQIVVGNVHSSSAFRYLCEAGVDSISVGNGAEFGQFTLLKECFELSKKYNVPIINNSGIPSQNKNIFKAFTAGCNSILIENDSTFNYKITEILDFIRYGLVSLNITDINQLHNINVEYISIF